MKNQQDDDKRVKKAVYDKARKDRIRTSSRLIDLTGQCFGTWTVIHRGSSNLGGLVRWHCICDCGVERDIASNSLRKGITSKCGCSGGRYRGLPPGEAAFNKLYYRQRSDGRRLGREWALSKEQFRVLTKGNCVYCGKVPSRNFNGHPTFNGTYLYNGIDRVDNNRGYTIDNCVSCCWECNSMKHTRTPAIFLAHIKAIIEHGNQCGESALGHMNW
jgi:hypothetical protein